MQSVYFESIELSSDDSEANVQLHLIKACQTWKLVLN